MTRNLLADETSPYLLQHKDNPVHWQPWNAGTLAMAQNENKPILLSIGYAACHWCHVMAHESFEDDAIAGLMNELFVNIKVDREERPDLDALYQMALQMMGEHGGWPLTMFLTPQGEPFWGGTYFPATARYGRPAFPQLLRMVTETFHSQNDKVLKNVTALRDALANAATSKPGDGLSMDLADTAAAMALRMVDPVNGGTVGAPKFPQPSFFRLLWRAYRRTGSPLYRDAVTITLDRICDGGIYDHLGGGFARYAVDDIWLAPHFEKMLYDNAQLIELLTDAWRDTRSSLYASRVRETVDWTLRDMRVDPPGPGAPPGFAFASAYDADSEGEEGRFYVWRADEIDALLGADAEVFKTAYDVTRGGNWEGKTILNRSHAPGIGPAADEQKLAACRNILLRKRNDRTWPLWDDKVLADWNGLMIAALARAGAAFDEPAWIAAAEAAFSFVRDVMTEDGRLRHSWRAGRLRHAAVLDDYANLARAALILFEVTGSDAYADQAEAWAETAQTHYWDTDTGGYFLSADDADDLIARSKGVADNAVPSGNGTMMEVLARLYHVTGRDVFRQRAEALARAFSGEEAQWFVNSPGLLMGYELLTRAVQVVIAGAPGDDDTHALVRAAVDAGPPAMVLTRVAAGRTLPAAHPAHGKGPVDGRAAAYVCVGQTCGLPVTRPDALKRALATL